MNKYEKLRAECYKRIYPDGVPPLEFGTEIIAPENHKCIVTHAGKPCRKKCSDCLIHLNLKRGLFTFQECRSHEEIEKYKILGVPLQIADVLRVFFITDPLGRWVLQHNGALGKWVGSTYHIETFQIEANINLALPLSHPSQDEVCGKVLSLLTKNKDNE